MHYPQAQTIMAHCSDFSTTFSCFLFVFLRLISYQNISSISTDIISTTCKQCASRSAIFNYTFCLTSLQTVPIAPPFANLQGLAVVAMKLAGENATTTISAIQKMMCSEKFDPFAKECLRDCLELYEDGVSTLVDTIEALFQQKYDSANSFMSAVMEVAVTCEEGFEEKEGEVTPLTYENYNLIQLSDIALCIINLLSLGFTFY